MWHSPPRILWHPWLYCEGLGHVHVQMWYGETCIQRQRLYVGIKLETGLLSKGCGTWLLLLILLHEFGTGSFVAPFAQSYLTSCVMVSLDIHNIVVLGEDLLTIHVAIVW